MTAATRSPGFTASANAPASTVPSPPTGTHSTSKPCRASSSAGSRTAGCSIALTTRRPSGRPQKPKTAWLSASEPPDVKTTWAGSQSSSSAIVRRAPSSAALASRPYAWGSDAFPNRSDRYGSMASRASGPSGVVAAWSR